MPKNKTFKKNNNSKKNLPRFKMPKVKINVGGKIKNINLYKKGGKSFNPTIVKYVRQFGTKSRGENSIIKGLTKDVFLYKNNGDWNIGKVKTKGRKKKDKSGNAFKLSSSRKSSDYKTFGSVKINATSGDFLTTSQASDFEKIRGNSFVYRPSGTINVPKPVSSNKVEGVGSQFLQQYRYEFSQDLSYAQMYAFYKKEVTNRGREADLLLYSKQIDGNKVGAITITSENLSSYESMIETIEQLRAGGNHLPGSDAFFNETTYEPYTNVLDIRFYVAPEVKGSAENMVYKTLNLPDKGVCGYLCLLNVLGVELDTYIKKNNLKKEAFRSLDCIKETLRHFKYGWRFYSNAFSVPSKKDKNGDVNDRHLITREYLPTPLAGNRTKTTKQHKAVQLKEEDVEHNIIDENTDAEKVINFIVDMTGRRFHIDLPISQEKPTQLIDDVRFNRNKIFKKSKGQFKCVFSRKTSYEEGKTDQTK